MNRNIFLTILILFAALKFGTAIPAGRMYKNSDIDKIKLQNTEIPKGFMYGKIPPFAKKVLLSNPWKFNRIAINKLTKRIYPGGSAYSIDKIHMSIITKKDAPFGDDIVCYIIIYRDMSAAKKETTKLKKFIKYNKDRTILLHKKNMNIFLHVDNVENFNYIQKMANQLKLRMETV